MKITAVEVLTLGEELATPLRWGRFEHTWKGCILVRVDTDEGVYGLGEAGMSLKYHGTISAYVEEVVRPVVVGRDPADVRDIHRAIDSISHKAPSRGIETYAVGGVEVALWDILGKIERKPIYRLLGGSRREMHAYWAPSRLELPVLLREMDLALADGFQGVKLRFIGNQEEDLALLSSVRRAAGDEVAIMVDANMGYDLSNIAAIATACADAGVYWLEEPVRAVDLSDYAETYGALRCQTPSSLPIAGGEGFAAPGDFRLMIKTNAIDICQPDCVSLGGVGPTIDSCQICEESGGSVAPHISCASVAGIAMSATVHIASTAPSCAWIEYDAHAPELRMRKELFTGVLDPVGGKIAPNDTPGHGVELVEDAVDRFRISR